MGKSEGKCSAADGMVASSALVLHSSYKQTFTLVFIKKLTMCCPISFQIILSSASALLKLLPYLLLLSPSTRDLLIFALQHVLFAFITAAV